MDFSTSLYEQTTDPTASENFAAGYVLFDRWINTADGNEYLCIGDGVWKSTTKISGGFVFGETSVYITPIFTADVDNLVIPNMKDYTVIIWRSTVNIDITSIDAVASGVTERNVFWFKNGNSNGKWINIAANDAAANPGNEFDIARDIKLKPGGAWWVDRNPDTPAWNAQAKV